MSATMKSYVAGLLKYSPDITFFLAPYVNSYKRFLPGTFAPTKIAWSIDNRTAGYRLVGDGTKAVRIECRIPGSDINPYLACAAQLAAGLSGIEEGLSWMSRLPAMSMAWKTCRPFHTPARGNRDFAQLCHAQKDDGRLGRRSLYAGCGSRAGSVRRGGNGLGNRARF
jgi:hypothetical protein